MTGEITLRGNVLPIGGLKEKVLAARRAKIKTVIIPALNEKDLQDLPANLVKAMNFVPVEEVKEVLNVALTPDNHPRSGARSHHARKSPPAK